MFQLSRKDPSEYSVAIIGGGVGGMAAAMRLQKRGFSFDVFEAGHRPGGLVNTVERGEWRMEFGPNTIPDRQGVITELMADLGIADRRMLPNAVARKRFVVRDRQPVALPMSPKDFLTTPLLTPGAKARLLAEPLIPKRDAHEDGVRDESLYNLVRRRLGEELADYAIDPFIAGTYGGSPKTLSASHVLSKLEELEAEYGSLILGGVRAALKGRKASKTQDDEPKRSELVNFDTGVHVLTDAMAARLGDSLHLSTRVTKIAEQPDETFHLWCEGDDTPRPYDAIIVAMAAPAIARLELIDADGAPVDLSLFENIFHPPMTMLAIGYRRSQVAHPLDGFGMLVPSCEPYHVLGAIFASTIFEDRAPDDHVLLMSFLGGRNPEDAHLDQERQFEIATEELGELLGITGRPVFIESHTWPKAIPQYEVGYAETIARVEAMEKRMPGLRWTGNWRDGISVADVVRHGREVAHSMSRFLHP